MLDQSVRATALERNGPLAGDDLIRDPVGTLTHAVTIRRRPHDVWPWLVQMGAGTRAGWYSYDAIDNGRRRSAETIVLALQTFAVGTVFPALPGETRGFRVLQFEEGRSLVLGWPAGPGGPPVVTWAFVLEFVNDDTRLVVRARGARGYSFQGLPTSISMPIARFVHFIMQRKQLLGIVRRAESRAASHDAIPRKDAA